MEEIETIAMRTYQNNLKYFAKEHKNISTLLAYFDKALADGDYLPQYDLEYLDGYFDIKILDSNTYIYSENSTNISKELTKRVNHKKNSFIFEGLPIYNLRQETIDKAGEDIKFIDGLFPLMKYYWENSTEKDVMKSIEKYIFVGTSLGLHLPLIHQEISAKHYLIVEDSLELFKLSLFTTDYAKIGEDATLYFCVADDENMFLQTMHKFLEVDFFDNRYLKYTHFLTHSNEKIKQIQNALTTQNFIFFPYKAELYKYLRPLDYMNDGYSIMNLSTNLNTAMFVNKPILVLGAGPSLQKQIQWLKNNHEKFIIIAASAILNTLYTHNITPSIVTHLDGSIETVSHYEKVIKTDFLKNTIMLLGANTHEKIRRMFNKEQIFCYEEGSNYFENFGSISTPCVGSFSIIISLILNANKIYLLGLDLAFNQETGETHANEHLYNKRTDMSKKDELQNTMGNTNSIFPVPGNFSNIVYTNPLLHASIQSLYRHIPNIKKKQQIIYNLNDGAMIHQTIPQQISDLDTSTFSSVNKEALFISIKDLFHANSAQSLSPDDVISLKKRYVNAQDIQSSIKEYRNSISHSNVDTYIYGLLGLVSNILKRQNRESHNLSFVYLQFFKFALSIISDLFNTKGLKNEKRHIKKVDKMLQLEMDDICRVYIERLEGFIKDRC